MGLVIRMTPGPCRDKKGTGGEGGLRYCGVQNQDIKASGLARKVLGIFQRCFSTVLAQCRVEVSRRENMGSTLMFHSEWSLVSLNQKEQPLTTLVSISLLRCRRVRGLVADAQARPSICSPASV